MEKVKFFYRKIQDDIINWIKNDKHALLIEGARQVGKSYTIEQTLIQNNIAYSKIDLIKQNKLVSIFDNAIKKSANEFYISLMLAIGKTLEPGTVIFIDEVQECKDIVTIIKYLVQETPYKYILSGSLLGIELKNIHSAPIGFLSIIRMYPMDLEEFYIANGLNNKVINYLKECFKKNKKVDEYIHQSLLDTFFKYLIIGGMPEAVKQFLETKNLNDVYDKHKELIELYKKDFSKYEVENKKMNLIHIYDLIPSELNSKTKRYNFVDLGSGTKYQRYSNSFNWLIDAGVALPVFNVSEAKIPLLINKKNNLFKLFMSDIGMLTSSYGKETILKLLDNGTDINCGAIYENFVASQLQYNGFNLYYYNSKSHGEVDFVIEYKSQAMPIEVKSGKDYSIHSSLNYLINLNRLDKAIVLSNKNVSTKGVITYLPIYMVMFIKQDNHINKKIKIDLSKL